MPTIETSACIMYANGIVHCSVCAPVTWTAEMIEKEVNEINPAGTEKGWTISKEPTFANGNTNPCPCGTRRQHWLMVC